MFPCALSGEVLFPATLFHRINSLVSALLDVVPDVFRAFFTTLPVFLAAFSVAAPVLSAAFSVSFVAVFAPFSVSFAAVFGAFPRILGRDLGRMPGLHSGFLGVFASRLRDLSPCLSLRFWWRPSFPCLRLSYQC